ncbi:MAG: hypothetical protein L3J15_06270 [Devosiaceae bacterium]|nr:hypothetical protein [Devosiaceae bacterium]
MQKSIKQLFLGVDGGGTKCAMRLVDENSNILAEEVLSNSSNLQVNNGENAYYSVLQLSEIIFQKAGLDLRQDSKRTYACFGMSGARLKRAKQDFSKRNFPFAKTHICDDIDIAQIGAFLGKDGAVLIIGTGSAGLSIINNERFQVGGWGFNIGDDMSGAILGRKLLRMSLQAHEGLINSSELTKNIMAQFDNSAENLMAFSFNKDTKPATYAKHMPLLIEHFEKNDKNAIKLIEFEMLAIEKYIHYFKKNGAKEIAIIGGFGERLLPIIKQRFDKIIIKAKSDPLNGAIILAKRLV